MLADRLGSIRRLCATHRVKSLFAFGSVCTDTFGADSDVDLLVAFHPMDYGDYADTYFTLAEQLEHLLDRPVDLVTDKSLSNPYFIKSVNESKAQLWRTRSRNISWS
ncbi:MAG: nucleotidyltransferase domain-containing protein [Tunicatimonas sp.]